MMNCGRDASLYTPLYDLTIIMPSLTRKLVKGHPYYYVRHCQRVDGRPTIVKTTYLGSLERILQALEQAQPPPAPQRPKSWSLAPSPPSTTKPPNWAWWN